MKVNFTSETGKKLKDLAAQSGCGTEDLVEDGTAASAEELLQSREMLNARFDDIRNGRVKPISRDEIISHFRQKSAAVRKRCR